MIFFKKIAYIFKILLYESINNKNQNKQVQKKLNSKTWMT